MQNADYCNILAAVQQDLQEYSALVLSGQEDGLVDDLSFEDVVRVSNIALQFAQTRNVEQFYSSILSLDTYLREHFANALLYIDDNALIAV